MDYKKINAETMDRWARAGWQWAVPITEAEYARAKAGDYTLYLTPTRAVPEWWLGKLEGKRVLGLAAGGGQQMPILQTLGAVCSLLELSSEQIARDVAVAEREGYELEVIRGDMSAPLPFADGIFDMIVHPISNCYVEEVAPIWRECYRVLKRGGRLLSGLDIGINYILDDGEEVLTHTLPFNPLKNKEQLEALQATDGGVQFSHTLEEQITGQIRAGFRLLDLYEDTNGAGNLHDHGVPTFIATLSEKE